MKKQQFLLLIIIIILVTAVVLRLTSKEDVTVKAPVDNSPNVISDFPAEITPVVPVEVIVSQPQSNELIVSPLVVTGQAKGTWFFEANIPVKLVTAENELIAVIGGTAQSDWMTEEMVPFQATLEFSTTATGGYLVIAKDNPSGLPENDGEIRLPVRFQ